MILGDASTALTTTSTSTSALAPRTTAQKLSPVAWMVIPGIVISQVNRDAHPFVWWAFGTLPFGMAAARLVQNFLPAPAVK